MWVRPITFQNGQSNILFQFTHPCGCDLLLSIPSSVAFCFNSRTRVGATGQVVKGRVRRTVSIHAPVWVRRASGRQQPGRKRFQFTHPCGCDRTMHGQTLATGSFNSRTRVGATIISDPLCLILEVSIHAPVWVRQDPRDQRGNQQSFNSRTRVGATQDQLARCVFLHVSIHAPVWVRPRWAGIDHHIPRFNSRTRVGATSYQRRYLGLQEVSIHAPVWVRPVFRRISFKLSEFQFTHPCGCDPSPTPSIAIPIGFNSRTRVGATPTYALNYLACGVSIHAPVWVRPIV